MLVCTIPLARGDSRSQSIAATVLQAQYLVENGYKEIVPAVLILVITESTTAHLSLRFCRRLKCKRCTLSHQFHQPNLLTQEIIDFILSSENFAITFTFRCKVEAIQFSVNEKTYTANEYRNLLEYTKTNENAGIGVDVIVVFGETDELFTETYKF